MSSVASSARRLRRCELAVPASSEKMIAKAAGSEADLAFLDLEDAVAPAHKESARANAIRGLRDLDWGTTTRAVRVNGLSTRWCCDEVIDLVRETGDRLDVVIVPKVTGRADVMFVDRLLTGLEMAGDLPVGRIGIEVLIEEAGALANVEAIASCSSRVEALILGVGDLSASLGIREGLARAYPGDLWHHARMRMIAAARAAGLDAVDGPYPDFRDADGYREEASRAAALGAVGKWAIHPAQIPIAHEIFSPTPEEVARAAAVVRAVAAAERDGEGAASVGGVMFDAAAARIYQQVLDAAHRMGIPVGEPLEGEP